MDDNNKQDDKVKADSDAAMQPADKTPTGDESPKIYDVEPKEEAIKLESNAAEELGTTQKDSENASVSADSSGETKEESKEAEESVKTEEPVEVASTESSGPLRQQSEASEPKEEAKESEEPADADKVEAVSADSSSEPEDEPEEKPSDPNAKWYVVHTFAGHENRVAATLKQRIDAEHLEKSIFDILVPTQDKIEIKAGKKETVKEKIFPGYILVKMVLGDVSWLAVRTTQGVTSFVGMGNKPTPISEAEVRSIIKFTTQGAQPTFKDVFMVDDTVKIIDGPFAEFIGKVDSVDKEKGRVRVLVSIFGRETPVELDFLQVQKL